MMVIPIHARPHDEPHRAGWRRIVLPLWRRLPLWSQFVALRLAARKVTVGACAVILDRQERVLVAHHTYRRRAWGLPGGLIGEHEQPPEALARELREELGVSAIIGPLLCANTNLSGHHLTLFYRVRLTGTPRLDGIELDEYRYAAPDELPDLLGESVSEWLPAFEERWAA